MKNATNITIKQHKNKDDLIFENIKKSLNSMQDADHALHLKEVEQRTDYPAFLNQKMTSWIFSSPERMLLLPPQL